MNDPIAEAAAALAAAPSSTEPSLLEKATNTIHELEAKLEHFIHPETANDTAGAEPVADSGAVSGAPAAVPAEVAKAPEPALAAVAETQVSEVASAPMGEQAEAATSASAPQESPSAQPSPDSVVSASAGSAIRSHIDAIKAHLSLQGFEQATVAKLHEELAAIERLL